MPDASADLSRPTPAPPGRGRARRQHRSPSKYGGYVGEGEVRQEESFRVCRRRVHSPESAATGLSLSTGRGMRRSSRFRRTRPVRFRSHPPRRCPRTGRCSPRPHRPRGTPPSDFCWNAPHDRVGQQVPDRSAVETRSSLVRRGRSLRAKTPRPVSHLGGPTTILTPLLLCDEWIASRRITTVGVLSLV